MNRQSGFTLIEIMISVAILGLLAGLASVSYASYVSTSATAKTADNYSLARRFVRQEFMLARQQEAIGIPTAETLPADTVQWLQRINGTDASAPGGGPAFVSGSGDATTGAIGIEMTGDYESLTAAVVITRPAYNGQPAVSDLMNRS